MNRRWSLTIQWNTRLHVKLIPEWGSMSNGALNAYQFAWLIFAIVLTIPIKQQQQESSDEQK